MTAGLEDVLKGTRSLGPFYAVVWASGWIARHTVVPAWATDELAVALPSTPTLAQMFVSARELARGSVDARAGAPAATGAGAGGPRRVWDLAPGRECASARGVGRRRPPTRAEAYAPFTHSYG